MLKLSNILGYKHPRHMKYLFTNIKKQQNMLKSGLPYKLQTSREYKLENSHNQRCKILKICFLYEPKRIVKFSNLHQCTFNFCLEKCVHLVKYFFGECCYGGKVPEKVFSDKLLKPKVFVSLYINRTYFSASYWLYLSYVLARMRPKNKFF